MLTPQQREAKRRYIRYVIIFCCALIPVLALLQHILLKGTYTLPLSSTILIFALININGLLLLLMLYLVLRNLVELIFERKHNIIGSKLRTRLVVSFISLSFIPTALLFVIALSFVSTSMDYWFNSNVEESLQSSLRLAQSVFRDIELEAENEGNESPADMKSTGWNLRDAQISKVYATYLRVLREAGALDFDDLLLKTVELVETKEHVREMYARKFKYILVDEYQDTNRPQYILIRRLADHHRNLCVVGDPDQSIYKWRGADLRNILDFEHDFPEATVVKLEQNYRSTQVILDAASAVISRNRNRKDKRLWTDKKGGEPIVYVRAGDEIEEADYITRAIRESRVSDARTTVAVLYRTNAQSRAIEDAITTTEGPVPGSSA